ncbi:MAG: hypothetical protein K8S00_14125 [Bacteroidales bacterium]|nr:hypothetical protein [Bacteroidales bacterium]
MIILLVEDSELTEWDADNYYTLRNPDSINGGLLINNSSLKTSSFIPIYFNKKLIESNNIDSIEYWFEKNLGVKIDYYCLVSGDKAKNLYGILDTLVEHTLEDGELDLAETRGKERWHSVLKNAELFLQDEVLRNILAVTDDYIPEKEIRKFISSYTNDNAEFYYMHRMVLDINSVNGYLYEREYIQQIYSAQQGMK